MFKNDFVTVVKVDGKILREDKDVVYIPFGSEYELHFKNLSNKKALVSIEIDGTNVMNGRRLIVDGNSIASIQRFVDENSMNEGNKFKFIQKTEQIQKHRGDKIDDGIIRIEVQYEKPIIRPRIEKFWQEDDNQWSILRGTTSKGVFTCSSATTDSFSTQVCCSLPKQDEGITVKGSTSNQKFVNGIVGELEYEKHVFTFQLKGIKKDEKVEQPITTKTKFKCETCGTVNKSNSKFCRECGTFL